MIRRHLWLRPAPEVTVTVTAPIFILDDYGVGGGSGESYHQCWSVLSRSPGSSGSRVMHYVWVVEVGPGTS